MGQAGIAKLGKKTHREKHPGDLFHSKHARQHRAAGLFLQVHIRHLWQSVATCISDNIDAKASIMRHT